MSELLQPSLSLSPLFLRLLEKRGLTDPKQIESFLSCDLSLLEDPFNMKGMREAAELVRKAAVARTPILIHGDYDVDGVTGTALMARTLTFLEASFTTFLPDRAADGYGVSEKAIRKSHAEGARLLITVDCGITAFHQMAVARELGMEVIIIDHHRIPNEGVPPATAILNPRQSDCPYRFKELSAAGLVYKFAQALIGNAAHQLLDLAALSTVCDVAPLEEENRVIVKKGLELLSRRTNSGIAAMAKAASLKSPELNTGHIGFTLGPRINAAGRMSSPDIALRLLMTTSTREAESLAAILEEENRTRQKEERQTTEEAIAEVERTMNFNRDRVIVVGRKGWHQGVIGIVASRLVDRFYRPAVVIAFEDGMGKGSGRSIKGFHLFNALESCKDLFTAFGGHEQAAGLSLHEENLPSLRKRINEFAKEVDPEIFIKKTRVDMEIGLRDFKTHFLSELQLLEPHGVGNPRPVFLTRGLEVKAKPERLTPQTLKVWVTDGNLTYEAFLSDRTVNAPPLEKGAKIDLSYTVKTKVWNGLESLCLEVKEIKEI